MMRIAIACMVLSLAAAASADELPMPRRAAENSTPEPARGVIILDKPGNPAPDVPTLRQALAELKANRDELGNERAAAAAEFGDVDTSQADQLARLRLRLGGILARLAAGKEEARHGDPAQPDAPTRHGDPAQPAAPARPVTSNPIKALPPEPEKLPVKPAEKSGRAPAPGKEGAEVKVVSAGSVDATALAHALFRAGDFASALRAYRLIDLTKMEGVQRLTVQYMMATCLRKLGQYDQATELYRKVAESRRDNVLADCARWQLGAIRWRLDVDARLARVRKELQSREPKKP